MSVYSKIEKPFKDQICNECFICGEPTEKGGHWAGITGDIVVCTRKSCIEKLFHIALDALKDDLQYTPERIHSEYKELTDIVYGVKAKAWMKNQ